MPTNPGPTSPIPIRFMTFRSAWRPYGDVTGCNRTAFSAALPNGRGGEDGVCRTTGASTSVRDRPQEQVPAAGRGPTLEQVLDRELHLPRDVVACARD